MRPRSRVEDISVVANRVLSSLTSEHSLDGIHFQVYVQNGLLHVSGECPTSLHQALIKQVASRASDRDIDFGDLKVIAKPSPPEMYYTVRPGDSYWTIALRKYGNGELWPEIKAANLDQRGLDVYLYPGDKIRLPTVTYKPR